MYRVLTINEKWGHINRTNSWKISLNKTVNLLRRSTSGLVVRKFMENRQFHKNIESTFFIATSKSGSKLADFVQRKFSADTMAL